MEHFRGFSTDVGQNSDDLIVRHRKALAQVAVCRTELTVGTAEGIENHFCRRRIRIFYIYGVFKPFYIRPHNYIPPSQFCHGHDPSDHCHPSFSTLAEAVIGP